MIITTVPASKRRPGSYHQHKFVPAGQSLVPLPTRTVVVAIKSSAGTATAETPVQVFDEDDADTKAGKGSEAALMLRKMLEQGALQGASPEIYLCPIAAPAGLPTQNTITVTGTATASGTLVLRIAGRTVNVGVASGDAQNTVATAIKNALDAMKAVFPFTAGVATNVVTTTNTHNGVTGNSILFATETPVAGVSIAFAQSVAGTGVADITNALDALYDKDYDGIAIANHAAADVTDALAHLTVAWGFSQQKPRFIFIGENGSLATAQTLATAANDKAVLVVNAESTGSLPGEIAAAACVAWFSYERPNINMDGVKLALYAPVASLAFTDAEVESALNGGVTPLTPTPDGQLKIESLITTKVTEASAPFEGLRDAANPRTAAYMGRQIGAAYAAQFKQENLVTANDEGLSVLDRVRDMVIGVQRAAEAQGILRDVDTFLPQIVVEEAASPPGRILVTNPFKVAGPLHQAVFVHTMYV